METWKKIQDVDYYISNHGNFKQSTNTNDKHIGGWMDKYGYRLVSYYIGNIRKREFVHRLVASYFITKTDSTFNVVNHIDGNKTNNHYFNLEWTNAKGNRIHAVNTLSVGTFTRSVNQYDLDGNLIQTFSSIKEAAKFHGSLHTAISKAVRGELKTHKNFIFKYADDRNNSVVDIEDEEWKQVIGFEDLYEVSNFGRIKSKQLSKDAILKQHNKGDYLYVYLKNNDNKQKNSRVHRLVAEAFIPNPNNLTDVNHIDHDKKNNKITNLEWLSHKDNCNK